MGIFSNYFCKQAVASGAALKAHSPAQISLQENMLASFLQLPHLRIHHMVMSRPRPPLGCSQPVTELVQSSDAGPSCPVLSGQASPRSGGILGAALQSEGSPSFSLSLHRCQISIMFEKDLCTSVPSLIFHGSFFPLINPLNI